MAKEKEAAPKIPPTEIRDGNGNLIPPEHFDDDQRPTGDVDKSPGSLYDHLVQRDKKK
jgi:hypothetical protein